MKKKMFGRTNEFSARSADLDQIKSARVAGIMFLFNLIIPTLGYVFIQSRLLVKADNLMTSARVVDHKGVFSYGLISEMALTIGLVVLGYSLYMLLRHVNKNAALVAFIIKCVEATLMGVVTLLSFLAFQMILDSNSFEGLSPEKIQSIAGFILNQHEELNSIPMILLGVEMVLFSFLLFKSNLIPGWISFFGILSFCLILIYGILSVTTSGTNLMMLTLPSFLFELICGSWLLIKGIKVSHN